VLGFDLRFIAVEESNCRTVDQRCLEARTDT